MTAISETKPLEGAKISTALKTGLWDYGLAALALLAAGALISSHWRISALEAELASRPQIAIVDYSKLTSALAAGVSPLEMKPAFDNLKARANAFAGEGWLVINRASLEAAPEELIISTDEAVARQLDEAITSALSAPKGAGGFQLPSPAGTGAGEAAPPTDAGLILKSLIRGSGE